ncbi:MAG: hypothetical protein ACLU3I_00170 [Acutalibacteraceae bacterium]
MIGDFSGYSRVFSAIMLGLLLAQALLSYDICLSGVMQALRLRFDQTSMLFVVLCVVIVDAFFAVMQGRTPFCTVASVLLLLALWGRSLLYEARRRSLRAAGNMEEPVAAVREEKAWHGYDCIFRAPGDAAAVRHPAGNAGRGQPHHARLCPCHDGGDARAVHSDRDARRKETFSGRGQPCCWQASPPACSSPTPNRFPRLRKAVPRRRSRRWLAGRADLVR